ncbi:hypothetical protein N7478_008780 [Penicillium angulare]|uniref:uncharacterized protein n=1 Tax=Penicillium angulare TaxID=116970 RepID=UPI0025403872|nr:uncharacterized protein N7478_008780 [Penicillium angulare]KAJ5273655.1 hypothetical protein N7478_008780 [Penicillium angulare]
MIRKGFCRTGCRKGCRELSVKNIWCRTGDDRCEGRVAWAKLGIPRVVAWVQGAKGWLKNVAIGTRCQ